MNGTKVKKICKINKIEYIDFKIIEGFLKKRNSQKFQRSMF